MAISRAFLALLLLLAKAAADEHIVLKPVSSALRSSKPTKMLVFIPGGKVPNAQYVNTAKAIQASSSDINLWVVIPAVFQRLCIISCTAAAACAPLHGSVESALSLASKAGWKRGEDSEDLWLAGHSLGGTCANTLFQAYDTKSFGPAYMGPNNDRPLPFAGLIVMGGYVDEAGNHDLIHYPVPVLTLNVELDGGLARPGKTATWWRQHEQIRAATNSSFATSMKPVIVLPRLNHSDFCPGFNVPGDLMAEVPQDEATATIGTMVAAFLQLRTPGVAAKTQAAAEQQLTDAVSWTRGLLGPYLEAQNMERDASDLAVSPEGASPFCAQAQRLIAGLSPADDARLTIQDGFHVASSNLEHCHPNYTVSTAAVTRAAGLHVDSCSHTDYYTDVENTGELTAASAIACKMISSDRIAQQLQTTAAHSTVDCRAVNRHAVEVATKLAAPSTLARYQAQGRGWCFLPDVETLSDIGPLWVFKDSLALKANATCMTVASPSLNTAVDGHIYPGNHYCKVLSPARVLDWMMTDSIKKE